MAELNNFPFRSPAEIIQGWSPETHKERLEEHRSDLVAYRMELMQRLQETEIELTQTTNLLNKVTCLT